MKNNINKTVAITFIIIALGFLYQYKGLKEYPSHIHAWAQADRYALSLGFVDNGLDFFKPKTFIYNHQFPGNWLVPSTTTITSVDFPIHDYIPALLMRVLGDTSPWIFRVYILLYSFVGLFFLYKLSYSITRNYLKSIFVVVFAATSPVYVYYQGGFLPTIPSLSNAIVALYFYYQYLHSNKYKYFWLSIFLLTLAALSRTTFAIPLIAVLCVEFVRLLKRDTNLLPKLLPVGLSILTLFVYFLYNGYLRDQYGSLFLNYLMPPESIGEAFEIIVAVYGNWFYQYFTLFHYVVFGLALFFVFYFKRVRTYMFTKCESYFGLLALTYLFGCALFSIVMMKQYENHDYYFLDSFFLPVILVFIGILMLLPNIESIISKKVAMVSVGFVLVVLILQPIKSQEKRRSTGPWDRTTHTLESYKDASSFLDSLGIAKTSKLLVIGAAGPNIPFMMMERKGYVVMNISETNIEKAFTWAYDYIIIQNEYFISDIYSRYPGILSRLTKIADNGKLSVCKLTVNNPQSLFEFIGLKDRAPVFKEMLTFESMPDSLWSNVYTTTKFSLNGDSLGYLASDLVYGLTYKINNLSWLSDSRTLLFSSQFLRHTPADCEVVVSVNEGGNSVYYKTFNLKDFIRKEGSWEEVTLLFQLPRVNSQDSELSVYLWNTGKSELFYDDFGFTLY